MANMLRKYSYVAVNYKNERFFMLKYFEFGKC